MRLLLDQNTAYSVVVEGLSEAGHDVTIVEQYGAAAADDSEILRLAADEDRIIVTRDTADFGIHLHASGATKPSIILMRVPASNWNAESQLDLLLSVLDQYREALEQGAFISIRDKEKIRLRLLPLTDD